VPPTSRHIEATALLHQNVRGPSLQSPLPRRASEKSGEYRAAAKAAGSRSASCARRRVLKATTAVESFAPRETYERDGWRCGLCLRKVDPALTYPHPRSASLDHIVPLSLSGEHVRANVQLAHLICNVRKGARSAGEQLLLVG